MSQLKVTSFGKSDTGLVRSENQDVLVIEPELGLFLVADGMGGAASGELASSIFAQAALEVFSALKAHPEQERFDVVQAAFKLAHERIQDHVRKHTGDQGMGCTAELAAFFDESCCLGHVGDSRTYLLRGDEFKQLTRDHSVVQNQIDRGLITAEQAKSHPVRNVIDRSVGVEENLAVDLIKGTVLPGDIFLLCTDGLTSMLDDIWIKQVLLTKLNLVQKVNRLIEEANSAGGHDNITVVLCEIGRA
jgi:serine/threonine protein phosphatase PrpC